jgi:hypothetical protein
MMEKERRIMAADKQHAHQLLDRLEPGQLDAVVHLMEVMTDPLAAALARAPIDAEPLTEAEQRAIDEADEWLKHNKPIPHEEVLAEFGLTMEDWDRMVDEPPVKEPPSTKKSRRNG